MRPETGPTMARRVEGAHRGSGSGLNRARPVPSVRAPQRAHLEQDREVERQEDRHEEGGEDDQRPDRHRRAGDRARRQAGKRPRREARRSCGGDEVEDAQQMDRDDPPAARVIRPPCESGDDQRRREADGDVAEPGRPGEQCRQHVVGVEHQEGEADDPPALQHGQEPDVRRQDRAPDGGRCETGGEEECKRHQDGQQDRADGLARAGGQQAGAADAVGGGQPEGQQDRGHGP